MLFQKYIHFLTTLKINIRENITDKLSDAVFYRGKMSNI